MDARDTKPSTLVCSEWFSFCEILLAYTIVSRGVFTVHYMVFFLFFPPSSSCKLEQNRTEHPTLHNSFVIKLESGAHTMHVQESK